MQAPQHLNVDAAVQLPDWHCDDKVAGKPIHW
ncbi:hypothetical protein GGR61_001660 [Xanthomonas arboricola]|nr:hypothetical protein [Xanthomonas sp. 3075]MBB5864045.1 hypothetical protein [Xanthomonas sp. 3058]